ncbi:hypothetical protein SDC9_145261 [bioreactor metagenome]|uniref:Uncharacterized protein n=1 Tax=bioreactor metagenome TaxID=1076179 RepID=A0A645E8H7_9ZZZZ
MKAYLILPFFSVILTAIAFNDDFLSLMYIVKMGVALSLLIISAILLVKDLKKKKTNN